MHLTGFNHENSDLDRIQSKKSALDQIQPKNVLCLTHLIFYKIKRLNLNKTDEVSSLHFLT